MFVHIKSWVQPKHNTTDLLMTHQLDQAVKVCLLRRTSCNRLLT